ncbi:MAG: glycosyltransferase family 39 protein, partial [Anaerolineales bacterium]|nr:glycosyltransferase family 39 protein [Anaerolineales bacterium]
AILQSSSTQNDLVVGVLCLSFAYFLLRFTESHSLEDGIFTAISFGLALLTKGTGYIYCAAIGIFIGALKILTVERKEKKNKLVWLLALIMAAGLAMNTGHFLRNYNLYGHPLSTANNRITTDNLSLTTTYANLIRNAAVQLATPLPMVNGMIVSATEWVLGQNINNTDATFEAEKFSVDFRINSDYSGNLIQMILLTLSLVLLPWMVKKKKSALFLYLMAVIAAIVLFNVSIKWQPWGSRLITPIFMLGSPLIAILIDKTISSKKLISLLVVGMFLFSVPFLLLNSTRPLVPFFEDDSILYTNWVRKFFSDNPNKYAAFSKIVAPFFKGRSILYTDREMLYFLSNFSTYYDYNRAMRFIREEQPPEVGLLLSNDDWEYPIWVFSGTHAGEGEIEFRHIDVEDISNNLQQDQLPLPTLVLATREFDQSIAGVEYEIIFDTDSIDVLRKID